MTVVEGGKAVVAGHGGLQEYVAEGIPVEQERRNERGALVADHLLPQVEGDTETLRRTVAGRYEGRKFQPRIVVRTRLGGIAHRFVVHGIDEMLEYRQVGHYIEALPEGRLPTRIAEKGVDVAAPVRPCLHLRREGPLVAALRLLQIAHVAVMISRLGRHLAPARILVPPQHAPKGLLRLMRKGTVALRIIRIEQRQSPGGIHIPGRQPEVAAPAGIVIELLQHMEIPVAAVAVAFQRIAPSRHVPVAVQHEILLGVVAVGEIVLRGGQQHAGFAAHPLASVREPEKLVERAVRRHPLDVFHAESLRIGRTRVECERPAQTASRHPHRTGSVVERRPVDEIGGDIGEVHHAEQGRIHPHAVPRHARMRGARPAERHGGRRSAPVRLHEHRRAVGQHIGQGERDILPQDRLAEERFLNAYVGQGTPRRHRHRLDGAAPLLSGGIPLRGRQGNAPDNAVGRKNDRRCRRFRPTHRQQRQQAYDPLSLLHAIPIRTHPAHSARRRTRRPTEPRFKDSRRGTSPPPWRVRRFPRPPEC